MKALQYSKLKLAFGILIPVLVMVVTLTMLGVSFAWFTNATEVYVESITLTVKEPYQINFDVDDSSANHNYRGQTAIAPDGRLVSTPWALENSKTSDDRAFCFAKLISLNSADKTVDFEVYIDEAEIYGQTVNSYKTDEQKQNLQYVFTWFFKPHMPENDRTIPATNKADDKNMIDYTPAKDDVWYTPYGMLKFGENSKVATVNGETYVAGTDIERARILQFDTNNENVLFDFFIVFAPEKLFWQQFFAGLDTKTVQETYAISGVEEKDNSVLNHIFGSRHNQMYYSGYDYLGSKFSFSATINVTKVYADEAEG